MNHRSVAGVLLVALLALLALTGCSASTSARADKSDRLPDVTLGALNGDDTLRLRSLRGPTVINLWASWCMPCRKELPKYQAFSQKYAGKVDVIGIDFQETQPAAARELARQTGVGYPLFSDPEGKLRAIGLPKVILLDERGRVAYEQYVEITSVGQLERLVETHLEVDRA